MKKIIFLLSSVLFTAGANAQLFTDNFESYTNGQYIGPASTFWTTWSGTEGGTEDVQATNAQASSGTNSIYLSSVASGGGPQDVVLEFGQQYVDGVFTFESDFYINAGKNAYFNFQATETIGTTWALNCNMDNGTIRIDDGVNTNLASGRYSDNTWFTLQIVANLTTGRWQAFVNGDCIGVWANSVNELASLNLYPILNSGFYVDDVLFDHETYVPSALNASVTSFNMGGIIAGLSVTPEVTVVNAGTTTINSFDLTLNYNGNQYVENITGQNLTAGQSYEVSFSSPVTLVGGENPATVTLSNINGGADDDVSDDGGCTIVDPIVPAPGKIVVGEEGTGTWCQWCPRGAVFMDQYEEEYGQYWIGIAVHNGDPMVNTVYDNGISSYFGGYPSSIVDRGAEVDPSGMSTDFFTRLQVPPVATITNTPEWDAVTRELQVTVTANFQAAANSNYKLACVLTEDGVTGTSGNYAQSNAYAGGGSGVMGGYELLPNPVPASQMVYDHVAREILPSFAGDAASFPATVNAGDQHSRTYTFTLPAAWNENNIHVIGLLIDPTGRIDNAGKSSVFSATGLDELSSNSTQTFKMYPNPATELTTVEVILDKVSDVKLSVVDMSGKEVASRDYGSMMKTSNIQLNTSRLDAGIYIVHLSIDNVQMTKRLVVQ
jgi:hypothetical protein